ncbi:MAG: hypothetical protein COT24_03100 [Candidatus Kerfeldbacteria bacterium CG08_land_8_20_14_0_20_40_16]|uniref:HTH cro/C1-type domain-containing protein n=1 Tax=Candidatus Kerfeldbacteria bacterium CG08_land_8_20_14_0_20_40_16 TaxID=2014244 RepID=A0A2H0YVL9_9BACT|nr:MAG: hypothetical protein COT24_03100 [Candidatus Kerfeldbacteria bacterium CG08_land_8_20_14_0_20_40_16]
MISFREKEISEARTLGDKLRLAREEERITLEAAEARTRIRAEYLKYLEESRYEKLPGEIYIRNFLITYAKFLHLNPQRVINLFEEESKIYQKVTSLEKRPKNGKSIVPTHPFLNPHFIRNSLIVLVILILFFYLGLELNKMISPPLLIVDNPSGDNIVTTEHTIEISGMTEKESKVLINGEEIAQNQDGYFQAAVDLKEGINVLKITAEKKHSKESIVYKHIKVESSNDS